MPPACEIRPLTTMTEFDSSCGPDLERAQCPAPRYQPDTETARQVPPHQPIACIFALQFTGARASAMAASGDDRCVAVTDGCSLTLVGALILVGLSGALTRLRDTSVLRFKRQK